MARISDFRLRNGFRVYAPYLGFKTKLKSENQTFMSIESKILDPKPIRITRLSCNTTFLPNLSSPHSKETLSLGPLNPSRNRNRKNKVREGASSIPNVPETWGPPHTKMSLWWGPRDCGSRGRTDSWWVSVAFDRDLGPCQKILHWPHGTYIA